MTPKRKKEIRQALADGKTVLYHKWIYGTHTHEKPRTVTRVWDQTITDNTGDKHLFQGWDQIVILKEAS
jgi:hypothetical protein